MSGGQKQRLAIARALYQDPSLLILDEATSALDPRSENDVLNTISQIERDVTVIIIAHRVASVKSCDKIFLIKDRKLLAEGRYEDLLSQSSEFNELMDSKDRGEGR